MHVFISVHYDINVHENHDCVSVHPYRGSINWQVDGGETFQIKAYFQKILERNVE